MKTIIIIALIVIVSLVIIGGGLGAFVSNVNEGTQKIKQNEQVQEITSKISSKLNQDVESSSQGCLGTARCIPGTVTQIIDGDTIKVDGQSIRFALASAPELSEYGGIEAKDFIDDKCPVNSTVLIDEDDGQTEGSYERIIGVIYCNGKNLNEELIESGHGYLTSGFCSRSEFSNQAWTQKHGC